MKISNSTINVLKNFTRISKEMKFNASNKISIVDENHVVFAIAQLEDLFTHEFCVSDLPQFVSLLTLDKETSEIEIDSNYVYITSFGGKSTIKYRTVDESIIDVPPIDSINTEDAIATFKLDKDSFERIMKTSSILNCSLINFSSDGEKVYMECYDPKYKSLHSDRIEICDSDTSFRILIDVARLIMISGNYEVKVLDESIYFKNLDVPIEYLVSEHSGI